MEQSSSTLIAHSGTELVSYEQLAKIPAPPATQSWKPVRHVELVDTLRQRAMGHGYKVAKEEYAVSHNGAVMFGVFDFTGERAVGKYQAGISIGFRQGNDKTMSIQLVAGLRVFVCDNLAFKGDVIALRRKHTSGLSLVEEIGEGFQRFITQSSDFVGAMSWLQSQAIADESAKAILLDSVIQGVVPQKVLEPAYVNYFEKREEYPDCEPRSRWGLHNAYTRAIKEVELSPATKFDSTIRLGKYFGLN